MSRADEAFGPQTPALRPVSELVLLPNRQATIQAWWAAIEELGREIDADRRDVEDPAALVVVLRLELAELHGRLRDLGQQVAFAKYDAREAEKGRLQAVDLAERRYQAWLALREDHEKISAELAALKPQS